MEESQKNGVVGAYKKINAMIEIKEELSSKHKREGGKVDREIA